MEIQLEVFIVVIISVIWVSVFVPYVRKVYLRFMKRFYLLLILICIFLSCERDKDVDLTIVSVVNEQVTPSYISAEVQCRFQTEATLRDVYLQYSLTPDFVEYEEVEMWENDGKYRTYVEDLRDNTIYYIRYAISNSYSDRKSTRLNSSHAT